MGEDNQRREVYNRFGPLQSDHLRVGWKGKVGLARIAMTKIMKSHQVRVEKIAVSEINLAAQRAF